MTNSEQYIVSKINGLEKNKASYSVTPNIENKVLINASNKIAGGIDPSTIVAVHDSTLFGSGKEGAVYTGSTIFIRSSFSDSKKISLNGITNVDFFVETKKDENGKEKTYKKLTVTYSDGNEFVLDTDYYAADIDFLADLLKGLVVTDENEGSIEIEESNHVVSLSELSDDVIGAYIRVVTAYLKADDGVIDSAEYKELISLMSRIKVSKNLSDKLRDERLNAEKSDVNFEKLISELDAELKSESVDTSCIFQSLFKDLLIVRKENIDNYGSDATLSYLGRLLNVNDDQAKVLIRGIQTDRKIVEDRLEDKQIKALSSELAAIAGGAGVTLAALAVTGGVSSGICGGLISLGLMSTGGMFLGIAAIGGLGYVAYKGIKKITGVSELEKSGIRIAALQSAIQTNKAAITYIIDDVNWLTGKIGDLAAKIKESSDINAALMDELMSYISFAECVGESGSLIEQDNAFSNYEIHLSKLPLELDKYKFEELANQQPNRVIIKEYIYSVYSEMEITVDEGEEYESKKIVFRREEEIPYDVAETAYNYLNMIGMYDTKTSIMASGTSMAKKGLNALKGLLGD